MELWIRSQNKEYIVKVNSVFITNYCKELVTIRCYIDNDGSIWLGTYKSKERALEVLDEIQNKIKQIYICEVDPMFSKISVEGIKKDLKHDYPDNEFIMQPPLCELKPINTNVVIYEMPKE